MNDTERRAATRLDPTAGPNSAVKTPRQPQPSGLTQDEIRQIVLDLLG
ncbi:hypothetical protein [Paracraurococcus lichenis]|uniref:Uncharacterized protein n=1 Tax=Paracraurococcus lichenis TaxID=3064888 RepID=A0ABT9DS46_9PROT|nr:hypothetical protein [Paracraurococcus sp. LOR1-02]MDO9706721.1 hypothetical protein [Paracraurococcus sp. LOR1-02]